MLSKNLIFFFIFLLFACNSANEKQTHTQPPQDKKQWINPLFFNENFESELSFPLWFNDSLIKVNRISKITKRIFPRIIGDTGATNFLGEAMPREKREYYFDKDGKVTYLIIYYYFDNREIARSSFIYQGKSDKLGFRNVTQGIFKHLSDTDTTNDFTTDVQSEREYNYVIHRFWYNKSKASCYEDIETHDRIHFLKQKKYWGALSVDSILNPGSNDWVIWGTPKKPFKRYKVENTVKEKDVYLYKYHTTGVLKERIMEDYPFEIKRSYQYNRKNQWISYIDSTISENNFITRTVNNFEYDAFGKPIYLKHTKENASGSAYIYLETFRFETLKKTVPKSEKDRKSTSKTTAKK